MKDEYEEKEKEKIPLIYIRSVSFVFAGYYSGNWDDKTKKDFDEIRGTSSILQEEIQSEKERQKEIDSLEEYVKTDEYIKEVAREKLGLIDPNEIIFKPNK